MEVESSEPKCKKLKIAGEDNSDSESDSGLSGSESEHTPEELFATLARKLAANTLRERNIAFAELKKFLFGKNEFPLEHNDAMRIWKGLFFMIWHSDGYQAQEDLCNQIAKFSKLFKTLKSQLAFYQGNIVYLWSQFQNTSRFGLYPQSRMDGNRSASNGQVYVGHKSYVPGNTRNSTEKQMEHCAYQLVYWNIRNRLSAEKFISKVD